jgi:hypothetical protein
MKHVEKIALGFFVGAIVLFVGTVIFNATDVALSPEALQAMAPVEKQAGYPLSKLQFPKESRPEKLQKVSTFQEYLERRTDLDAALERNKFALEPLFEAMKEGKIAVENDVDFRNFAILFPFEAQGYFLVFLSQKFHAGYIKEGLELLESSNHFLASFLESPQLLINTQVALSAFRSNAIFAKSLEASGIVTAWPLSVKKSFALSRSAEQIFDQATQRELQLTLSVINSDKNNLAGALELSGSEVFGYKLSEFAVKSLFRPHQTSNVYAKAFQEMKSSECLNATKLEDCSPTLRDETHFNSLSSYLVNPVGRAIVQLALPRLPGQKKKIVQILTETSETVASLKI